MKNKILVLLIFTSLSIGFLNATTNGYKVRVWGYYVPGSGGNGNLPRCITDPTRPCVIIRAICADGSIGLTNIISATIEIPDLSSNETSINSVTKIPVNSNTFDISYTLGTGWVGPFAIPSTDYSIEVLP
ncbi:MAG: hypothetical protein PSX81_02075 [bacterium]|nr:hypothetical protein [bacterium]